MKQLNWYQIFGKSNIPDGRTVEPTDDIQIWLNCADIWDKTYTTLAEVLADTDTLLALITSNNAVDYMVRSIGWTISNVPTMTSYNTPKGEVIFDTEAGGYLAWYAFDGNLDTMCASANNDSLHYYGYDFGVPVAVNTVKFYPRYNHTTRTKVQASNDNVTWVDLSSFMACPITGSKTQYTFNLNNTTAYRYYRCAGNVTDGNIFGMNYYEIQFYANPITADATAMTYIGQNNYASNTLLADETWCEAICNSTYFESVLNAKVPAMTSASQGGYVASDSSHLGSSNFGYLAFDNIFPVSVGQSTNRSGWYSNSLVANEWVSIKFPEKVCAKKFVFHNDFLNDGTKSRTIKNYKVQGSNDGSTWTDIGSSRLMPYQISSSIVMSESVNFYSYYRLLVIDNYGAALVGIEEWQFYGRKDI
jgi:hypothetical protein